MNDLISVVVPVYNVQMYLKRCLQSVVQQSYQIMVRRCVDVGSSVGSGQ